ncbi:MAG TPA: ABC transporter ATP-binding protein [Xanthobacteraceae bacterium]|nr:ABC transporter ATP-binding protein [Xanthobacteraceae bacterium]
MLALKAKDLEVSARIDGDIVPAIRALSFDLAPGKILGLVGESGAGKSMVGRTIAQLLPPGFAVTAGSLLFEGEDLVQMAPARRRALLGRAIAFIPQAPMTAFNPVMSIGAQFDEHLARFGEADGKARRARAVAMLEAARLPRAADLLRQYPHQLSGGMCQRVLIAMAFASNPRLVIADEPTTALDVTLHPPILRLIADMQREHRTAVIFITHDLRLAAQLCDDVTVMYAGRAVESGAARAVLSAPAHPYTRCLQLANPTMQAKRRALYVIPDQMPSLRQLKVMRGCHFAPRCPLVVEDCRRAEPVSTALGAGRSAACFQAAVSERIDAREPAPVMAHASTPPVLQVEGLQKTYTMGGTLFGGVHSVTAVQKASFSIAENEFVAMVGESGSGKSTIAKMLVGLEQPSAGRIVLNGEDLAGRSLRGGMRRAAAVQMVFQDPQSALNPRRRVASIVTQAMEAGSRHASRDERLVRTRELLAEVGLPADFAGRLPSQLSGGQRQRVNVARALCNIPKVLVADEIVSGLDVSIQAQLLNLLARLRAELGFAMLLISHDLSVVRHLCSRVLVMYRGEIVEAGDVETVFANPQHPHTRALLGSVPPDEPEASWSALASAVPPGITP